MGPMEEERVQMAWEIMVFMAKFNQSNDRGIWNIKQNRTVSGICFAGEL